MASIYPKPEEFPVKDDGPDVTGKTNALLNYLKDYQGATSSQMARVQNPKAPKPSSVQKDITDIARRNKIMENINAGKFKVEKCKDNWQISGSDVVHDLGVYYDEAYDEYIIDSVSLTLLRTQYQIKPVNNLESILDVSQMKFGGSPTKKYYDLSVIRRISHYIIKLRLPFNAITNTDKKFDINMVHAWLYAGGGIISDSIAGYMMNPDSQLKVVPIPEDLEDMAESVQEKITLAASGATQQLKDEHSTFSPYLDFWQFVWTDIIATSLLMRTYGKDWDKVNNPIPWSKMEVDSIIHLIILGSQKGFDKRNARTQLDEWCTKRINAYRAAVKEEDLDAGVIRKAIDDTTMLALQQFMQFYNQFSIQLFSNIIQTHSDPRLSHLKLLLARTATTTIHFIYDFIKSKEKTMLHVNPTILNESLKFLHSIGKLKSKFGTFNWGYYKLIDPQNTECVNANWPTLALAAIIWAKCVYSSATMRNYQFSSQGATLSIDEIGKLLKQRIDSKYIVEGADSSISETQWASLRTNGIELGFDWDALKSGYKQLDTTRAENFDIVDNVIKNNRQQYEG